MKPFLRLAMVVAGASVGGWVAARAIEAGRRGTKGALKMAELVADKTKDVLAQTESALRTAERSLADKA